MICIFDADATDFTGNGLGVLMPTSCIVSETLNGEYELTMEHPLDEFNKWRKIQEGRILRVPVPAAVSPQVNLVSQDSWEVWKTNAKNRPLRAKAKSNGRILKKYKQNKNVTILSKGTTWFQVIGPDGKRGYMNRSHLTYVETKYSKAEATGETIEPTRLRDQPFRIYRIVPDLEKVTVYARHLFYDLLDNMLQKITPSSSMAGATLVDAISAGALTEHEFDFFSDLVSTASDVTIENVNPIDALMGGGGLIENYGGEIARDWYDVYVVQRVGADTDIQIREGKNLLGVSYDIDTTNVVTKIMPTGQDAAGNVLYLPEVAVDSEYINDYPHPKWMHISVSEAREVTKGNAADKRTKAQCYTLMRNAAQEKFDAGCDLPDITLKVDFINITQTEEYRDYNQLQNIYLGDTVKVVAPKIGIAVSMRMKQYKYDCILDKYTEMTLGTVAETIEGSTISSRQIPSGSIGSAKLAPNSVGGLQLMADSVVTEHLQAEAITAEKIAALAITAAQIAAGAIVTDKIDAGAVTADKLAANAVTAAKIDANSVSAAVVETDAFEAATADIAQAEIGSADIGFAQIKDANVEQLIARDAVTGRYYIRKLQVDNAQMVQATVGALVVKAGDGKYYRLDFDSSGNLSPTEVTLTQGEITAGETADGRGSIIETDLTVTDLAASNMKAINALIDKITTKRLYATQAFIDELNTSVIQSPDFVNIVVGAVDEAVEEITPAVLRIDSSRGNLFKQNNVNTVLSVTIHYGSQIITTYSAMISAFGSGTYLEWQYKAYNSDTWHAILSTDTRLSDHGFQFTLSPADVDTKVTFQCILNLPSGS